MINKTDYVNYLKCPTLYYLRKNNPEEEAPLSTMKQNAVNFGIRAGEYARGYFGNDYYLIDRKNKSPQDCAKETLQAIKDGHKIICEASFIYQDLYCAIDILKVNDDGSFEIYEVKSSKSNKDNDKPKTIYYDDVSFQYYVLNKLGYNIKAYKLLLVNRYYIFNDDLCPSKYFKEYDVKLRKNVEDNINKIRKINSDPGFNPITLCKDCGFKKHCMKDIPDNNIWDIRGNIPRPKLYANKIITFKDFYDNKDQLNMENDGIKEGLQQVEYELFDKGTYVDKPALKEWLDKIKYPVYHLDFEGIKDYMPFIKGTWIEFERPIQYSLDVQYEKGGPVKHFQYLIKDGKDNLDEIIKQLIDELGTSGSILVYNKSYEYTRFGELAKLRPQYAKQLIAFQSRIYDLMVPFQYNFVYKKEQKGSYSIKEVLPAYCPEHKDDYKNLPYVHKGDQIEAVIKEYLASSGERREYIRNALFEYCGLDTMSEVYVLDKLYDLV